MNDIPPLSALMEALDFDMNDLQHNRGRQLTVRQRQRIERLKRRALLVGAGVFLLLALAASLLIYLGQRSEQPLLSLLGVLATVLNAIAIGFSARSYYRLEADLRESEPLEIYEGILERVVRPYGQVNNYVLRLANHEFSVTKDAFKLFRHKLIYAIYATKHSNLIMSTECYSQIVMESEAAEQEQ